MSRKKDRPVLEAALETGEAVANVILDDDVLGEIPIIGTAIKVCKAADAVRDRIFAAKLIRFVQGLSAISEEQKQRFREKLASSPDEAHKVGETLLLVLEKVTDLDKPLLLSQIFVAYMDGIISGRELRRLCQAIDTAFADDLHRLLTAEKLPEKSGEPGMQYLVASGLTRLVAGGTYDELGKLFYEITPLANKLRNAFFHGRKHTANDSLQGSPNGRHN